MNVGKDWKAALVCYFAEGARKRGDMLGVEVEHFILDNVSGMSVPYSGEKGVRRILRELMDRYPGARALPDDDFFGFGVPDFTITLEPAAQLEISIAPMESVERIGRIYREFRETLAGVLSGFGFSAVNAGVQPNSPVSGLELIPKRRYALMDAYFREIGTGGMEMMRGTASLQVSLDYHSEEDFRSKMQAAYFYGPVLKMFCDNSASFQGEALKTRLKRTDIWRRVDKSRCGIVPGVFSETFGFSNYADFLGEMPPIFLKEGGDILPTGHKTVREFFEGRDISGEELTHIISMAFPDVRLKQFIEIRHADSVPENRMLAYCALIKGLFYGKDGLPYARERIRGGRLSEDDIREAEDGLMLRGWQASVYGEPAVDLAKRMLDMARGSLPEDERKFLDPFYDELC